MTKRWFGITWETHADADSATGRGSTVPYQFMLEYWKLYEGYMQRKEHLVEAAITAYSALAIFLLIRPQGTWQSHGIYLAALGIATSILVEHFIYAEFLNWHDGVKLSVASQSLAADWLAKGNVPATELDPVPWPSAQDARVRVPQALKAELDKMGRHQSVGFFRRLCIACDGGPFAKIAYRLILLWWLAFVVRGIMTRTQEWWGLSELLRRLH
jgi:hypothetical protein